MKKINSDDYFRYKTYIGYIAAKSRKGGIIRIFTDLYKKIRKYTLISAVFKAFAMFITLLEKSAVLLLFAGSFFLILPVLLVIAALAVAVSFFRYIKLGKTVKPWLAEAEKITVIITKERIFSNKNEKLFLRIAEAEASDFTHPVIVVCRDNFIAAKWFSLNLLAVKTDYFFLIKRHYFRKTTAKITYMVI